MGMIVVLTHHYFERPLSAKVRVWVKACTASSEVPRNESGADATVELENPQRRPKALVISADIGTDLPNDNDNKAPVQSVLSRLFPSVWASSPKYERVAAQEADIHAPSPQPASPL